MESSKFDELTKALATATSRRQALRRLGGILGGTALAGLFPGLAFASNSACAHFCNAVFGADTPAANQCSRDGAHGKGLCHQCGSAAPSSICCTRDSNGFCSSYSGAHCPCNSSICQTCQNGTCASSCDVSLCQTCQNGTCVGCNPAQLQICLNRRCCIPSGFGPCSGNESCCSGFCIVGALCL